MIKQTFVMISEASYILTMFWLCSKSVIIFESWIWLLCSSM